MVIFNLFSKRQKAARGEVPDVYKYDEVPNEFRVQIVHIFSDMFGVNRSYDPNGNIRDLGRNLVAALCREYGTFTLPPASTANLDRWDELFNFILRTPDIERFIDAVELCCVAAQNVASRYNYVLDSNAESDVASAIDEVNVRFKQNGVGYQFIDGEIIRVDSELIHAEAVKPALRLLNTKLYKGAQEEFLAAYEHYRHGRNKEALNDCLKAFESTMKAICDKRRWSYDKGVTAKGLIDICFKNNLIPSFWQTEFSHLKGLLESSVPTGRNKLGGHGQGSQPVAVPAHLVAYMLHMTASTLVFLIEAERSAP